MWVILAVRRPEYRPASSWLVRLVGFFLLANLLAALFGVSFQRSFWSNFERMQGVFDQAHWFVLLVVVISVVKGVRQWRAVFIWNLIIALFVGLLGMAQRHGVEIPLFSYLGQESRVFSTLGNATFLGAYMMIASLLAVGLLMDSFTSRERIGVKQAGSRRRRNDRIAPRGRLLNPWMFGLRSFFVVTAITSLWVLTETGSRGAFIGLLAGVLASGLMFALWYANKRVRIWALGGSICLILMFVVAIVAKDTDLVRSLGRVNSLVERSLTGNLLGGSASERIVGARIALQAFGARPITGWGAENFSVPFHRYMRADDFVMPVEQLDQTHNRPLEVLSTTGIFGLMAYVAGWVWMGILVIRGRRNHAQSMTLHLVVAALLLAYFVHTLFLFETSVSILQFVILAAFMGGSEPAVASRSREILPGDVLIQHDSVQRSYPVRDSKTNSFLETKILASMPVRSYWLPAGVVSVLVASIVLIHLPAYDAGQLLRKPTGVEEAVKNLERFPPLATYGQIAFPHAVGRQWHLVPENQYIALAELVRNVSDSAIKAEPENITLYMNLSRFYHEASRSLPELIPIGREVTNEVSRLGPNSHIAHELQVLQAFVERDLEAMETAVTVWKEQHPDMPESYLILWDNRLRILREAAIR